MSPNGAAATPHLRTHPLTPLVEAVRSLGVLVAVVLVFGVQSVSGLADEVGALPAVLAAVVLLGVAVAVLGAGFYLRWTRTEYYFDETGDFRLDSGVLQRQERRVTLSRLQSVDVVRPLLGRIVGLSQVRIEVAGSSGSGAVLSYLSDSQAQQLRAEIIARAAGIDPQAGEAPEAILAEVPTGDLVTSLLLRSETFALLVLSVLLVVTAVATEGAGGLMLIVLTGGLPLLGVFGQFSRFFGFTVADSPDGLRLRHGLASVQSQTVPPGRVQAVEIAEPLLWRRRGWVRVSLNVAGTAGEDEESQRRQVLLPVAPAPVAAGIIARVLPGVQVASVPLAPAPRAARRRAPLQSPTLGVGADDLVLVTRRGFLTRRTAVIPHARTQSVRVTQGPWQRRLGLASVHVDSTPGPVEVAGLHRGAAEARAIAEEQLGRAAAARAAGPAQRWMTAPPASPALAPAQRSDVVAPRPSATAAGTTATGPFGSGTATSASDGTGPAEPPVDDSAAPAS